MTKDNDTTTRHGKGDSTTEVLEQMGGWPWAGLLTPEENDRIVEAVTEAAWQTINMNLQRRARDPAPGEKGLPFGWFVFAAHNVIINTAYKGFANLLLTIDPLDTKHLNDFKTMIDGMGKDLLKDTLEIMERIRVDLAQIEAAAAREDGRMQ